MAAGICVEQILTQFSRLQEAFIDTSSLLYMEQCDFLILLSEMITLRVVPGVCLEYGPGYLPCTIHYNPQTTADSTDMALCAACLETGLPLISEDKRLLKRIAHAVLPYFNSLMMLNFLLYKQAVSSSQFVQYHNKLYMIARYSSVIWDSGAAVTEEITVQHRKS